MKTILSFAAIVATIAISNAQNVSSNGTVTSGGFHAGSSGNANTFYGAYSGFNMEDTGSNCVFIGNGAGYNNNFGSFNTFVGISAGGDNETGSYNVFVGANTAEGSSTGNRNSYVGYEAGQSASGSNNTYLGHHAGNAIYGDNNTCIGYNAGKYTSGSNNIFIGYNREDVGGNNKLYIDNSNPENPLIWGDFAADQIKLNGKVGIGLTSGFPGTAGAVNVSNYKLFVSGGILAKEVRVATTWADYVFGRDYRLTPLKEVEQYISENGHLPNIPSATDVERDGISLGDIARLQQEKIEELTLYAIQQQKQMDQQRAEIDELKAMVRTLTSKK